MTGIKAQDIEQWADRITASTDFPRLLSRLIWASARNLSRLEMPGGELARLSGFDGLVVCGTGDDMVPHGYSAWELSVENNPEPKAEQDYDKRTGTSAASREPTKTGRPKRTSAAALGVDCNTTTFVVATARRWPGAENWAQSKREQNHWKDVRVLWSCHLETWLARVPWIAAEFAPRIRNYPLPGIETLDMIWIDYSAVVLSNELDPDFVIAERTAVRDAFIQWITTATASSDGMLRISGPTEREVLHYLSAIIRGLPQPQRDQYESLIFAVHDPLVAQSLGGLDQQHVVIVTNRDALPYVVHARKQFGCRIVIVHTDGDGVLLPEGGVLPKCLRIERIPRQILIRSLVRLGFPPTTAAEVCAAYNDDYLAIRRAAFLH